jgi:hypothetical protein
MARWLRRKALREADLSAARSWMIAFAIFNVINAVLTISETQAENRVPVSAGLSAPLPEAQSNQRPKTPTASARMPGRVWPTHFCVPLATGPSRG